MRKQMIVEAEITTDLAAEVMLASPPIARISLVSQLITGLSGEEIGAVAEAFPSALAEVDIRTCEFLARLRDPDTE